MGPKTLPTIWHAYMKLVTKYQISAIDSCWENATKNILNGRKEGRTDGRTEVKQYTPAPPPGSGGITMKVKKHHHIYSHSEISFTIFCNTKTLLLYLIWKHTFFLIFLRKKPALRSFLQYTCSCFFPRLLRRFSFGLITILFGRKIVLHLGRKNISKEWILLVFYLY